MRGFGRWREIAIDGEGGQERPDRLKNSVEEQEDERPGYRQFIGLDVGEQAPHEARVVRFAENFLFHVPSV